MIPLPVSRRFSLRFLAASLAAAISFFAASAPSCAFLTIFSRVLLPLSGAKSIAMAAPAAAPAMNEMIEFFRVEGFTEAFKKNDKNYAFWEASLKEFVGHTPLQVIVGCVLGIIVALLLNLW